jgi:hypothetical protein
MVVPTVLLARHMMRSIDREFRDWRSFFTHLPIRSCKTPHAYAHLSSLPILLLLSVWPRSTNTCILSREVTEII